MQESVLEPEGLKSSSESVKKNRRENVELCVVLFEAYLDEVHRPSLSRLIRRFNKKYKLIDSGSLGEYHTILEFIYCDGKIDIEKSRILYRSICQLQIDRCREQLSKYKKFLKTYAVAQKAREMSWPSSINATPLPTLKARIKKANQEAKEIIQSVEEIQSSCDFYEPDSLCIVDDKWSESQHIGEVEDFLKRTNEQLLTMAKAISEVQKERRERTRLNVAIWALFLQSPQAYSSTLFFAIKRRTNGFTKLVTVPPYSIGNTARRVSNNTFSYHNSISNRRGLVLLQQDKNALWSFV